MHAALSQRLAPRFSGTADSLSNIEDLVLLSGSEQIGFASTEGHGAMEWWIIGFR
jgi:hypothetical protein